MRKRPGEADSTTRYSEGARPSKRVKYTRVAAATTPRDWAEVKARSRGAEAQLDELLRADPAGDGYLCDWADRIPCRPSSEDLPPELHGVSGNYADPELAYIPFIDRCRPPCTDWVPLPSQQVPPEGFEPDSLRDILEDIVLDVMIPEFVRNQLEDLRAYREHGPDAVRNFNRVLAVGQDLFKPKARGIIWDLRDWQKGGKIKPLDFQEPVQTHLNLPYLESSLEGFPDQELKSFLLNGVQLHADLELQLVFLPHLTSLKYGIDSVADEPAKLASKGWYEFFAQLPFLPARVQPQGSVPRKLEERWRRVMEAGAPRKVVYDTSGLSVVSLNEASRGTLSHHRSDIRSAAAQRSPHRSLGTTRGENRWPPEVKPRVSDYAHDGAVLRHLADKLQEPVFAFGDDLSNMFHQFRLASSEFWKVCVLYDPIEPTHTEHTWAVEYVLAMGLFQASNVAQRFAHFLVALFRQFIHLYLLDTPEFRLVQNSLSAVHTYGDANPLADAASRGYFKLLHDLCQQLGVRPTQIPVPADLQDLVNAILIHKRSTSPG